MDFDIIGSRRQGNFTKKTEIRLPNSNVPIVPDGIFGVSINGEPRIYILEIHRKTETKQVVAQLKRYIDVLETGAVATKYGLEISPLVCSVHMKDSVLKGVKSALLKTENLEVFTGAFLYNSLEQLSNCISTNWTFSNNQTAEPFIK